MSAQVDENVARAKEAELVGITTGRRTVHLNTSQYGNDKKRNYIKEFDNIFSQPDM